MQTAATGRRPDDGADEVQVTDRRGGPIPNVRAAMTGGAGRDTTPQEQMVARIGPLVDQLQRFWRAHENDEGAAAATEFRVWLEGIWPDVAAPRPKIEFEDPPEEDPRNNMDEIVVELLRGVGEIAGFLLAVQDPRVELAWVRERMLERLEIYEHLSGAGRASMVPPRSSRLP